MLLLAPYGRSTAIISIGPDKCKKECDMTNIILVQGFCPPKIKITQYPDAWIPP